jgi:hypothetical protein
MVLFLFCRGLVLSCLNLDLDKTRQSKTEEDKARKGKTRQGKARQNKTGQG